MISKFYFTQRSILYFLHSLHPFSHIPPHSTSTPQTSCNNHYQLPLFPTPKSNPTRRFLPSPAVQTRSICSSRATHPPQKPHPQLFTRPASAPGRKNRRASRAAAGNPFFRSPRIISEFPRRCPPAVPTFISFPPPAGRSCHFPGRGERPSLPPRRGAPRGGEPFRRAHKCHNSSCGAIFIAGPGARARSLGFASSPLPRRARSVIRAAQL